MELLGLSTGLRLLKLLHLIYPRLLTRFDMLFFFSNVSLMEFLVRYLALFLLFSIIDGFEWFWMENLHKKIESMLEFLKALFLVLGFSYYTLKTFLMMLYVILLDILMILLSTLSVIRHLICGNYQSWLLNLNLIYEALWAGAWSGFLISVLEKLNWFNLTGLITLVLLMWKWMGLFLRKNHLWRCWGWLSLLNWIGALTLSLLLKLPPRKLEPWFVLWSFLLLRLLCISIYLWFGRAWNTGDVWAGAPSCYLEFFDKLQSRYAGLLVLHLLPNIANLSLFYSCYFGRCSSELVQLVPFTYSQGRFVHSDRLHDFSVTIPRCYKDVYDISFFPHIGRLWNSLPIECFPLIYDLNGFQSRINSHLLTVGSFWTYLLYALVFSCLFFL